MFNDSIKNAKNVARKVIKVGNIHVTSFYDYTSGLCEKTKAAFTINHGRLIVVQLKFFFFVIAR